MADEPVPIVCDMTDAPDTPEERIAEYRRLFEEDLTDRARTETGIRFRFRAREGLLEQIRDLATREKACCAFFSFEIRDQGEAITWDVAVVDEPLAHQILEALYALPDQRTLSVDDHMERFTQRGLVITDPNRPR